MNEHTRANKLLPRNEYDYKKMNEVSLLAERERLLLLKKMFDEASDYNDWSKETQDEALNASDRIYEIQEILNERRKDEQADRPKADLAAK